jgi:hypothetical protein
MSISEALRARYSTEVDIDWREVLVFEHPNATPRYLVAHDEPLWLRWGGEVIQFQPCPFEIKPPKRESTGAWEFSITIGGIGLEASAFLREATDRSIPITATYCTYILGSMEPQRDPIEMALTDPTVGLTGIVATGSRADLLSRAFPRLRFTTALYPGLVRS